MSAGHDFDTVLDYPLPRIRRLLDALARHDATRHALLVDVVAMGSRASAEDIAALKESINGDHV